MCENISSRVDLCATVGIGTDQAIRNITNRYEMQIRVRFGRKHHREILRARHQIKTHLRRIIGFNVEGDLRKSATEVMHQITDFCRRQIVLNADAQGHRRIP